MDNNNTKIKNKRKKVRISIITQLISIISTILIFSLAAMIVLASYFFKTDSEVRIKENNHKVSEVISLKVKTDFQSIIDLSKNISNKIEEIDDKKLKDQQYIKELSEKLFANEKDIFSINIIEKRKNNLKIKKGIVNYQFIKKYTIKEEIVPKVIQLEKKVYNKSFNTLEIVHNVSPHFKNPVITISLPYNRTSSTTASSILVIFLSMNKFLEAVKSPGITKTFIVNGDGDLIAHHDRKLVTAKINLKKLEIVKQMITSPMNNSQTRYKDEKGLFYLGSFYKVGFANTGVIASVLEDKAFEAVYRIQKRNFLITIIVLCLSVIVVHRFSKTLTKPIFRLVRATKEIEEGNYELSMNRYPRNELGLLMRSFKEMGKGLAEREKMKDAFGKFVNPEIAEMVLRGELKLGGERKNAAVFFSDIRSFTAISEKLEPEEVVEFLNEYMSRMVDCVNDTHGVVDKFIGDAVMAIWGAPVSHGNDTENAINGALRMRKALLDFNKDRGGVKRPIIKIGCGINTGPVLAGQIGSQDKMEYTVIGDTVNLASRIETLSKPFSTDILISEDSYALVKDIFHVEPMQKIKVKGKVEPQQIYAVLGRNDDPSRPKSLKDLRKLIGFDAVDTAKVDVSADEKKYEILESDNKKNFPKQVKNTKSNE